MSRLIILDTETTGLEPRKGHRMTEVGCLEMVNRKLTGRKFHTYLNPEREVDAVAAEITGLTFERLKNEPKFSEVVDDLITFLFVEGTELVIHNAPFDLSFLNAELVAAKHPFHPLEAKFTIFDTLALARRLHPGQKNNLDALCKRYNVDNTHRQYHGALLDAEILSKVYLSMTAGQSSLAFGLDSESESELDRSLSSTAQPKASTHPPVNRAGVLPVIKATLEERQAHEKLFSDA